MTENIDGNVKYNPEVVQSAERRQFTAEYERRIALEAESCNEPGEIGALLRREGLYASVFPRWRRQLRQETLSSSKGSNTNGKRTPAQELTRLRREHERLNAKLCQAETESRSSPVQ